MIEDENTLESLLGTSDLSVSDTATPLAGSGPYALRMRSAMLCALAAKLDMNMLWESALHSAYGQEADSTVVTDVFRDTFENECNNIRKMLYRQSMMSEKQAAKLDKQLEDARRVEEHAELAEILKELEKDD